MSRKECGVIGLCPMLTNGSKITDCDDCQSIDWGAEDGDVTVYGVVKAKEGEQNEITADKTSSWQTMETLEKKG